MRFIGSNNTISRIDMLDHGYGYTKAPQVTISSGLQPNNLDVLYAIWQGSYVIDTVPNNIIDISLSQTNIWTVRPVNPLESLVFPTTTNIDYIIPNAGYVNFDDIDLYTFDNNSAQLAWGSSAFNPIGNNTIWVANTFPGDWDVYKLVDISYITFQIVSDAAGNLDLLIPSAYQLLPQYGGVPSADVFVTDFGNLIVLQVIEATATATLTLGGISAVNLVQEGANYYAIPNVTVTDITGVGAVVTAIIAGGVVTGFNIVNPGSGYSSPTIIIAPPTSVGGATNNLVGFQFDEAQSSVDPTHNYYDLVDLIGNPITATDLPDYANYTNLLIFGSMRIQPGQPLVAPSYAAVNDKIWVDQFLPLLPAVQLPIWGVFTNTPGTLGLPKNPVPNLTLFRQQSPLINTSLFQSASIFDNNNNELVQLPIYDPFKGILPGPARQNITYITKQDPATYNVTQNPALFSENITFDSNQVGQLWWDLSATKYVYYEQPIALDGSETPTDNLFDRLDHWGQIFPGSTVNIYEWTQSTVPPSQYTGTGTPKDVNTYAVVTTVDPFTDAIITTYYFWVLGATDQPNVENRTLPAIDVSLLLQSPISQNFSFFCPIQQTPTNNSYMFYNVLSILAYQGNNVQIQYRTNERNDQRHAQWSFFREGDPNSLVLPQFWEKMTDSLCAWTEVLPVSPEFPEGIPVPLGPGWDTFAWDTIPWDAYGLVLPVPDPSLSDIEQLGIEFRPRQGMFFNLLLARQVFVEAANALLQYIPIRDSTPSWNANVGTETYWTYTNYYAPGFVGVTPTVIYPTQIAATNALNAGQLQVGTIVQVNNATADGLRYILYQVVQPNPSVPTLSFNEVAIQNSAIMFLNTLYTTVNVYGLSVELRQMLNALQTEVFIDEYIVDQNELFFSMLNFVVSEKKNSDWVFKSSNIYIAENNLPLNQPQLYVPNNIDNIIDYIMDVKPYHVQIRDYISAYTYTDVAIGTASDTFDIIPTLAFGPTTGGVPVTVPQNLINANTFTTPSNVFGVNPLLITNINQFISGTPQFPATDEYPDSLFEVPLTFFDASKIGYSQLFPYTFVFDGIIGLNPPQTFITPANVIGVQIGSEILIAGQDFYVEFNNDNTPTSDGTYTIYFYNNPPTDPVPVALVWWNGGLLQEIYTEVPNSEIALGYPDDDTVANVDTQLPVNFIAGIYTGVVDAWDYYDAAIEAILETENGGPPPGGGSWLGWDEGPWDQDSLVDVVLLPNTISYKENTNVTNGDNYYRNAAATQGVLVDELPGPTSATYNISAIVITATADILPNPVPNFVPAIWINGERIEYLKKTLTGTLTWTLELVRRGTMGTSAVDHLPGSFVFVEQGNLMPANSPTDIWNAISLPGIPINQDPLGWDAQNAQGEEPWDDGPWDDISPTYTSISNVPLGGLWYATTPESEFLKAGPGISI
jgi:hypothetical protein